MVDIPVRALLALLVIVFFITMWLADSAEPITAYWAGAIVGGAIAFFSGVMIGRG